MTVAPRSELRVGVIGVGAMGTSHVHTLSRWVPTATVTRLYDFDAERADQLASQVGAVTTAEADDLIAADDVDAVVIASPDLTHEELVLACLAAGKPVFSEKPLATTAAGSQRIVDAEVAGGRLLVQVGFMRRYDRAFRELRDAIQAGAVGTPRMMHCIHRNGLAHPSATSDGVVTNSMIHDLDSVPWLLGDSLAAVTVVAPHNTAADLLDLQLAVLETSSGLVATVEVYVNAGYGYDIGCEVVGDAGTARLTPPYGIAYRRSGSDGVQVSSDFVARFADAYRVELADWVDASLDGTVHGPTAWDGHRANVAAAAGVESLHTGARVAIGGSEPPSLYG